MRQQELLKQQARRERANVGAAIRGVGSACSAGGASVSGASGEGGVLSQDARRGDLRRRTCNVRVNQLHAAAAEALETDV